MAENRDGRESVRTVDLVRSATDNAKTLIKKEMELARQEMSEALVSRIKGVAAMAVAAVFGLILTAFLGVAAAMALRTTIVDWAAWLVVAGGYGVIVGASLAFALRRLKRPALAPTETIRTLKEDSEWAKAQLKR